MSNLLKVENLSKHYDGFELSGVSFAVPAGSVVGLIGSNGAGKSTTIKSILGLIRPDGGSIQLFGEEVLGMPDGRFAQLRQRVGVVFDTCAFPATSTLAEVRAFMAACYDRWDDRKFAQLMSQFELSETKMVKELSRGMGMKLSLACALAAQPDLLVLDEATAGLDPIAREEALDLLREFVADEAHGILMSSHITSDLDKLADYILCIDGGRIMFSTEADTITDQAGIAQCRRSDLEAIAASGLFEPGSLRYEQRPVSAALLVPDRFAFAQAFPNIPVERADIDSYMYLALKGEQL